jgi:hypothetical protein
MAYTTRQKVEQYLNADLSAVSSEVGNWITAAEKIINAYLGYSFASSNSDKYYDLREDIIFTDRFTGTPTVVIYNSDGSIYKTLTEGLGNDFTCQPYNEGYFDRIVFLKNPLMFENLIMDEGDNEVTYKQVKVTANFGAGATVPEDIALACTMIVAGIAEKRLKGGNPSSESLGDYSITYKSIEGSSEFSSIKAILDSYKQMEI